ncbi:MAG: hypothetical protein J7501_05745 [Bdellovibrio sp.]|nr:hypothetical protein [Bdellovibrio sp.]
MKQWILTLIVMAQGAFAHAFVVESGFIQQASGQYVKSTSVTCDLKSAPQCRKLCQNPAVCVREEPYCRNCAGTTSPLLRQLFTELSRLYTIKNLVSDLSPLVQYMASQSYVLLGVDSVFNYYTPVGGDVFVNELKAFCGDSAPTAMLVVKLDPVHQPFELSYVLCRPTNGETVAFEVMPRQPTIGQRLLNTPIIFNLN